MADFSGEDFTAFLLAQIKQGKVRAYEDNYFRKTLTPDEATKLVGASKPSGFRIKEDWIYHRDARGLASRIIGIAPLTIVDAAGVATQEPLFWVYYPEVRPADARAGHRKCGCFREKSRPMV